MAQTGSTCLVVVTAGLLAAAAARAPVVVAVVVPGAASVLAVAWLVRRGTAGAAVGDRRRVLALTVAVYLVHFALGLIVDSSLALKTALAPDALAYHDLATHVVAAWRGTDVAAQSAGTGKEGFVVGLAALYWLFGPYPAAGLAVVAGCSAALVPVSYDTTRRLFGDRAGWTAAVLVAVLPGFVIWSSQLLREAPIVFLLATLTNAASRLNERVSAAPLGVLAGSLVVMFTLRANVALIALSGTVVGLSLGARRSTRGVLLAGAAVAGVVGVALLMKVGSGGLSASTSGANLRQVAFYRHALGSHAGSAINADVDITTPSAALAFLPTAVASFLFGPFPWQVTSLFQGLGVLDAFTIWILAPAMVRGLRLAVRDAGRRVLALVAPAALLLGTLSLLIGNYGMIVRERPQVIVLLVPIMAHGWVNRTMLIRHRRTITR